MSSSRTSCHPAAADGLQHKLAQRAGPFFWPNGGANESSVSPLPSNLAGSHASFPPDSVKSPKFLRKLPTRLDEIPQNPNAYRPAIKTLTAGESCVAFSPPSL